MQKSRIRFASQGEPEFLVLVLGAELSGHGQEIEVFALPLLPRDGGLMLALPSKALADSVLNEGQEADDQAIVGPSHSCTASLIEEGEGGCHSSAGGGG